MLLTQTAAGSEVEETVQDTVDTITGFNKFIQEKGPDLIAFGIRILMALLIFIICHKVINWIRKITRASMERANSDTGARQFVDSLLKYGLHILLFLAIINLHRLQQRLHRQAWQLVLPCREAFPTLPVGC